MSYRWNNPHEWLFDKLEGAGEDALLVYAKELARIVSADDIQNSFQNEMDEDGYFNEVAADSTNYQNEEN